MKTQIFWTALAVGIGLGFSQEVSLQAFKAIPIMDAGRVKPLDTYARITLLQLSSRSSYRNRPAIDWLARVMFTPNAASNDAVFRINNIDVVYTLGLEPTRNNRYTFAQLAPAISKLSQQAEAAMKIEEKQRTPVESELIRVANNLSLYVGLMNSFLFTEPNPDFQVSDPAVAAHLGLPPQDGPYSFMEIRAHMGQLAPLVQPLMGGGQGKDPSTWSPEQKAAFQLFQNFTNWSEQYRDFPIPIIPPAGNRAEMWMSPWGLVARPNLDPGTMAAVTALQAMDSAFVAGQPAKFDRAVNALVGFIEARGGVAIKPWRLHLEIFYNALDPFYRAKILYGLAILGSLLAMMVWRKWLSVPSLALLVCGALLEAVGIGLRVVISGRAPVSNLFETFLFVSFIGALLGIALELFHRKGFGTLVGSITGFLVLLISSRYNTDGDTIGVLVAVLNSNFWLSTHVITISLGYAGCCIAGVIGHLYLMQTAVNPAAKEKLDGLSRMTYAMLAFGLLFAFIGTILGGIWADQSWGRFWGWDPKENGALLIVLWGTILFHAKLGKMIGPLGMAVGSVLGIVVVMMAWFGINLLGVGLHSYGFTSGVANSLAVYVSLEALFLVVVLYFVKRAQLRAA